MSNLKVANAPAGHIAKVMSKKNARPPERCTKANVIIVYRILNLATDHMIAALLDREPTDALSEAT